MKPALTLLRGNPTRHSLASAERALNAAHEAATIAVFELSACPEGHPDELLALIDAWSAAEAEVARLALVVSHERALAVGVNPLREVRGG